MSIITHYVSNTFFSLPKALAEATIVIVSFTLVYSFSVSYFCYVPKERVEERIRRDIEEMKIQFEKNFQNKENSSKKNKL
jgi:hypothetical protein